MERLHHLESTPPPLQSQAPEESILLYFLCLDIHQELRVQAKTHRLVTKKDQLVAVGTTVTRRPPHRSVLAALLHTAPAKGIDVKSL